MNILLLLPALVLMTACHQSPIKTENKAKIVAFLMDASRFAEKNTPFHDLKGAGFIQCMTNNTLKLDCPKFFNDMVAFAQTVRDYKTTTVSDLKDKALYQSLKVQYQQKQFDTL